MNIIVEAQWSSAHKVHVHNVEGDEARHIRAKNWCINEFGSVWHIANNPDGVWIMEWLRTDHGNDLATYVFSFIRSQDAVIFRLRWS